MKKTCEISEHLRKTGKLEGGLFALISLVYCGRGYVARRDLFTVKDGKVYAVRKDGSLFEYEHFSLYDVERACHKIGAYNPSQQHVLKAESFSYSEIKKLLKL